MRTLLADLALVTVMLVLMSLDIQASEPPRALVFEFEDQWTHSAQAADLLAEAGFSVEPLPLDESPFNLDADVIVLGSFVSEHPAYADYMANYAEDLYNYVDHGHLLVQFTQADQAEDVPPFLPSTQGARRCDNDYGKARVLSPEHTLMAGLAGDDGVIEYSNDRSIWEVFNFQSGFEVLITADVHAQFPAVVEGAYGQGRILLVAMALDKANLGHETDGLQEAGFDPLRKRFFANLYQHAIDVNNLDTRALNVTPSPRVAAEYVPGSWTLALLPDTQVYALRYPGLFLAQTGWIANHAVEYHIEYVFTLGDITNNNTPGEWRNARDAFRLIDGLVPYTLVPGNHDYGPSGDASSRESRLNEYFDYTEHTAQPSFGGVYEEGLLDNSFHLFSAGGIDWVVLCLEWAPRDEVVAWANGVMEARPGRRGILLTHSFMYNDDTRTDHTKPKGTENYNPHNYRTPTTMNDGQELWDKLVRHHDIPLVFSGHILGDGTGYRVDANDAGTPVHQVLANYQMRELGGEGYLRLVEFQPGGKVQVKSYSPLYDAYLLADDQQFSFELE